MRRSDTELRALRDRFAGLDAAVALAEAEAEAEARCVLRAVTLQSEGAYPTTGGLFFSALPQVVTGPEKEGGTPTFAAETQPIYPYAPGSGAPAVGSHAVAALMPYRWALTMRGGPNTTFSGHLLGCGSARIGVPGDVTVKRQSDGVVLWTGTADSSGAFSGSLSISATTTVIISGSATSSTRLADSQAAKTVTKGASNAGLDVILSPNPGFFCINASNPDWDCSEPWANISYTDSNDGVTRPLTRGVPSGVQGAVAGRSNINGFDYLWVDPHSVPTNTIKFVWNGNTVAEFTSRTCPPAGIAVFTEPVSGRTFTITET